MSASGPLGNVRATFEDALLLALTEGRLPLHDSAFGSRTRDALQRIVHQHPEASPTLVADAYDAFDLDEGATRDEVA
ncbi:hypothetical protein [Mycolicibacterium grossiae]|uniref:Uncharacterized protein n=1 Tax=Mycolicibacterium grossiae TaxID=1552759 RepID=A0A1E8PVU2_9MYCO|nr:hypothetical protein [Mycolicibacterium grossiae]OFJ50321.1 hypothetical protein BEL07_28940 [Mycolicibacterium grossiae]QEM47812.1 hypothetical protein FZ046_26360 [Mycolicibacterium grossiae]